LFFNPVESGSLYLHFNPLTVDELTAGDETVEHQSHLAAGVDNNVVALPCDLNQSEIKVK
jgi:hypothetical protein